MGGRSRSLRLCGPELQAPPLAIRHRAARFSPRSANNCRRPKQQLVTLNASTDARTGQRLEVFGVRKVQAALVRSIHCCTGERVLAELLRGGSQPQDFRLPVR